MLLYPINTSIDSLLSANIKLYQIDLLFEYQYSTPISINLTKIPPTATVNPIIYPWNLFKFFDN